MLSVATQQRYDTELQAYLRATGLQASDLAKPRPKKKEPIKPTIPTIPVCRPMLVSSAAGDQPSDGLPPFSLVWSRIPDGGEAGAVHFASNLRNESTAVSVNAATGQGAFLLAPFG